MILTADAEIARRTNRRPAYEGFNTAFIGANRYTRKPTDPEPDPNAIYPMAFLVEKQPGAVVRPHFHQAHQFQVVVGGGGRMGTHDVAPVAIHYNDPYSAYGPIVAGDQGIQWFTLRNAWDPGARYMPEERTRLRAGRARWQHREAVVDPRPPLSEAELAQLSKVECLPVLPPGEDGLGGWRYRLPAGASALGPDPRNGGGQFWLVLAGRLAANEGAMMPVNSCIFVPPGGAALSVGAGEGGAEALCLQFPMKPVG